MSLHYFTFGIGSELAGYCQPIMANTPDRAREKMCEMYGNNWSFQYTVEEREQSKLNGYAKEELLNLIIVQGE